MAATPSSRRILVVQGHPDGDPRRLCRALADAYAEGAAAAGHAVERIDLAAMEIPMVRDQEDFRHGSPPPAVLAAQEAIRAADHVVLLFPLWLGTMPALVKAFLEQTMRPGFAFGDGGTSLRGLLKGRSARVVVTMGMPAFVFRWWFMAHGVLGLERNILKFVGFGPVRHTLLGAVESVRPAVREGWLARMRRLGTDAR
ncbi:MAG: NAD(P)H-dependent oxidoreductase [Alphaproteobacteria bacterium]|nr:NAD(P)H-dependent oxidoreductase [Alphaproteobacteria bacterium]